MIRRAAPLLLVIFCFAFLLARPINAAPPKTISVETYREQLQKADSQLQNQETRAPRQIAPALQPLAKDQIVQRTDGKTQPVSGDQWRRFLDQFPSATPAAPSRKTKPPASGGAPAISREDVKEIRAVLALRLRSLDEWAASSYQSADAQMIMKQLEDSGQIRTGPTWLENAWTNFRKWTADTFQNLWKWFGNLFPAVSPGKMPAISAETVRLIFTLTVIALLAAIALLVWRIIGGKISRDRKKQGAFAFSPEDAELLALPPDELRERANRFAAECNFREALRHMYIALLLNFDSRGVWRYDARRTNWEHIAALQSDASKSNLVAPLSSVTRRFDRVRYGNASCAQSDWQQFESDVNALENSAPSK